MTTAAPSAAATKTAWQPLNSIERRVLGVMIEKAKTTPDAYPLSLNAIRTGCNHKSTRDPVMDLEEDAVQDAVDSLRQKGVMLEIQGGGRVPKYRHMGYEWLGVDKREIAIITELLLRGPQTLGELRSHVSRMEPIADLPALHTLLDGLIAKGLVTPLTPEGRGQVVSHTLYHANELQRLRAEHGGRAPVEREFAPIATTAPVHPAGENSRPAAAAPARPVASASTAPAAPPVELGELRRELSEAKSQIAQLREELQTLRDSLGRDVAELQRFRQEVGG